MYQLVETIRLDEGVVNFLEYHQQRVDRSVGIGLISLDPYISNLKLPVHGCFKLRITYREKGIDGYEIIPYIPREIRTIRLVTDDTICYDRKWSDRSAIEKLFNLRNGCDDILIVRNGFVTDSSFANVMLYDGSRWVTPSNALLAGTCRARLIDQGVTSQKRITAESLSGYSKLTLINAMIGFDPNRLVSFF